MKNLIAFPCLLLLVVPHWGWSQESQVRETNVPGNAAASHLFLQVHVSGGELFLSESGKCGDAQARISAADTSTKWLVSNRLASNGNAYQEAIVHRSGALASNAAPEANLRKTYRVDPMASQREVGAVRSEFRPDPTMSTDLSLHLGSGSSLLDLSHLTLHNLSVESAFSDLVITYSKPNQTTMQKMHVHAANSTVVLKHLELSRAKLVQVQNDMGDTKLMLGEKPKEIAELPIIELRNGVGDCLVVVSSKNPVRVVVKTGVLAKAEVGDESGFSKLQNTPEPTFENAAAKNLPDAQVTMIHCNLDFGELVLISR
ncbi:MAG: hypothetical protein NWR72_10295 [Bacteroidia bacterium]|nr:hypothetical protein [Bacteroidia bacterium]